MPIIKSAIKRVKQSEVRRSRNLGVKRAINKDTRAFSDAVTAGAKDTDKLLAAAYSQIDRAVKKGVLHKNTAARRKSTLAALIAKSTNSAKAAAPAKKAPAKKTTKK